MPQCKKCLQDKSTECFKEDEAFYKTKFNGITIHRTKRRVCIECEEKSKSKRNKNVVASGQFTVGGIQCY